MSTNFVRLRTATSGDRTMLTTIEVKIDKTGHLHSVESGQAIKAGRALLTWLEPDTAHDFLPC